MARRVPMQEITADHRLGATSAFACADRAKSCIRPAFSGGMARMAEGSAGPLPSTPPGERNTGNRCRPMHVPPCIPPASPGEILPPKGFGTLLDPHEG